MLDGENWPLFFNFQYIDVREAKLPSEHFYRFLANITLPGKQKGQLVSYTEISSEVAQGKKEDSSKKLFISYRRDDSADVAGRIYDRLIAAFKKEAVFKDVDSIPLGVDFREHIGRFIQQSEMLLVIIGKSWASITDRAGQRRLDNPNDFVRIEIEMAFNNNIPIIPVLVNDATMPDESELPETLKKLCYLNAATVRRDPDFHRDMDYVITSIQNYSRR